MRTILSPRETFTKFMFDEVLKEKRVIFLETFTFTYWVGKFYKSMPRGEFYMAKETVVNPAMCMWINRNMDSYFIRAIHVRSRWITESGLPQRWKHLMMEQSRHNSSGVIGSPLQSLSSVAPLRLQDVAALMQILLAGSCIALAAFLVEVARHRAQSRAPVTSPT
ncbi:uncharacterized protein LOC121833270 [Ixodes scapularis]|uniref:uncharacterized protein LOC121833270 n=1 Tax=Ixodes scapularis TaxID=6945 RepID=UPI001C381D0E|nr:uncharacterized protein LOC121833270 [Ixodes scapularis]